MYDNLLREMHQVIVRVFCVQIHTDLKTEFESAFSDVAKNFVGESEGLLSVEIGKPITSSCTDYIMITRWKDLDAVKGFAGEDWQVAVIPGPMKKYMKHFSLMHFEPFGNWKNGKQSS